MMYVQCIFNDLGVCMHIVWMALIDIIIIENNNNYFIEFIVYVVIN